MGSSAQNSSGVHWCRRRVRFNEVPEKVPKVPEKVWEALVQSQVTFNGVPEKVPEKMSWRLWCRARSGSTGFRRRFRRRCLGGFGAEPGQVQQGSGGSGEGSRKPWCKAKSRSTGFRRRFQEKVPGGFRSEPGQEGSGEGSGEPLVQSQVRFNRVPEKVPEKVWEALVQSQVRFNRICGHLTHGNPVDVFPALGFAARFRKICKNKTLRLLGISPKLIVL